MSGGSHDYAYAHLDDLATSIEGWTNGCTEEPRRSLRLAFAQHLRECAQAAFAIEWVDSCDWGDGDEVAAVEYALRGILRQVPDELRVELL